MMRPVFPADANIEEIKPNELWTTSASSSFNRECRPTIFPMSWYIGFIDFIWKCPCINMSASPIPMVANTISEIAGASTFDLIDTGSMPEVTGNQGSAATIGSNAKPPGDVAVGSVTIIFKPQEGHVTVRPIASSGTFPSCPHSGHLISKVMAMLV
jgi:hypothetical protein